LLRINIDLGSVLNVGQQQKANSFDFKILLTRGLL